MDLMEEFSKYKHYVSLILILVAIYMFTSGVQIMFTIGVIAVAFGVFFFTNKKSKKKVDTTTMVFVDNAKIVKTNIRKQSYKIPPQMIPKIGSTIKHRYFPEVKYSYKYNGKTYQNDKMELCIAFPNIKDAQGFLNLITKTYKQNKQNIATKKLPVFVNTEDPQDSLLAAISLI